VLKKPKTDKTMKGFFTQNKRATKKTKKKDEKAKKNKKRKKKTLSVGRCPFKK